MAHGPWRSSCKLNSYEQISDYSFLLTVIMNYTALMQNSHFLNNLTLTVLYSNVTDFTPNNCSAKQSKT